jgi:sporulation protein YqfD
MILQDESVKFKIEGLNLKKFLKALSAKKIEVLEFEKIDYNTSLFCIKRRNEKEFLHIAEKFHYIFCERNRSPLSRILKNIKNNIVFFVCALVMVAFLLVTSGFVFQTKIVGLSSVSEQEVLAVLAENGFEMGKFKSSYNLDSVERTLTANIDGISYASAIIKGNTLVVNINEKIDNSQYVYNYAPIVAPFNCIIQSLELLSGTQNYFSGDTVLAGEAIVSPYVFYSDSQKLPVPAKATVHAYVELTVFGEFEENDFNQNSQKYIEEKRKELYTKLGENFDPQDFELSVSQSVQNGVCLLTVTMKGNITISN